MTWLQRYRLLRFLGESMWFLPTVGMIAAIGAVRVMHRLEAAMEWQTRFDAGTALTLLGTLATALFTCIVFVCSALLITVQLASAQLTPRVVGIVLQGRIIRYSLAIFVFTFTFALGALAQIGASVHPLTAYAAVYGCLVCLGLFLYLVDRVCSALRPSGALGLTARLGREVIQNVYPTLLAESQGATTEPHAVPSGEPRGVVLTVAEGMVLAVDMKGLVGLAQRAGCVIELVPQVGDFVAEGQPLFRIFGDGTPPSAEALYHSVAIGPERTLQQDPAFALRIMVDIASKALSPAINDPTTAVLAIDQIQCLLRQLGLRQLEMGQRRDARGALRLLYRTPNWDDFVCLAVTEVRHFGGSSIQIARRLRAMLEDLIQTLPAERTNLLRVELDLLSRSTQRSFGDAEDVALADVRDLQGVGGRHATEAARALNGGGSGGKTQ